MRTPKSINPWSATFRDHSLEDAYSKNAAALSHRMDTITIAISTTFFGLYAFIDLATLNTGHITAPIRISISVITISWLYWFCKNKNVDMQILSLSSMTFSGLFLCWIIFIEKNPNLEYYKGITQLLLTTSILLRVGFLKWTTSLIVILLCFRLASMGVYHGQRYENILLFMATIALICAVGVYNLETSRRKAYLMNSVLKEQSDQLQILNAREVQSAKSKNAMINILAHFYNTPVHQIKGFSELLQSGGKSLDQDTSSAYLDQIIDSTVSLNRFTQKVLEYNTLPEVPRVAEFTTVSISSILKPAIDDARALTACKTDIDDFKITGPADQLTMIMTSLVDNIAEHAGDISLISITARLENGMARIEIRDNGTGLTTAQFAESVVPFQELTKFMAMGEKVPMGLRYAEKVLHMLGGEIRTIEDLDGTKLRLTFPAIYDAQYSPWLDQKRTTA